MSMKILMHCYEFPPLGGGAAKVVYGLSTKLVEMGHEVDVVTMGYKGLQRHEVIEGVNVYRISWDSFEKIYVLHTRDASLCRVSF